MTRSRTPPHSLSKAFKDNSEIRYNDLLLLRGIPAAAFDYRLGNRSALEWVIDQYRVSTDAAARPGTEGHGFSHADERPPRKRRTALPKAGAERNAHSDQDPA
jgi:hypothetical protein